MKFRVDHMPHTWRATVLIDNKDMLDVTVQADDAWHAEGIIEQQYRHIIFGPSRVFITPPNVDDGDLPGSDGGRLAAPATPLSRLSVAEFFIFALWIGALAFFRSRGLSLLWTGTGTGILVLGIFLRKFLLHGLRKRTKRFIREKDS